MFDIWWVDLCTVAVYLCNSSLAQKDGSSWKLAPSKKKKVVCFIFHSGRLIALLRHSAGWLVEVHLWWKVLFDIFRKAGCSSAINSFGHFIPACLFRIDLVMSKYFSESCESNRIFKSSGWKLAGWELINSKISTRPLKYYRIEVVNWLEVIRSLHRWSTCLWMFNLGDPKSSNTVEITYCITRAYRLVIHV